MAFNAFDGVKLSADESQLFVDGHSNDDFKCSSVETAVISVKDDDKRLQASVEGSPLLPTTWSVTLDQSDLPEGTRFGDGELVYVVGVALSETGERFVWGGVTASDGTIAIPTEVSLKEP